MAFTLRTVVREKSGKVGVVIERRPLRALTVNEARREVDRGTWGRDGIEPNGFEIVNDEGTIVAQRSYAGENVYTPWT
jgi:hypothetical protein